MNMNALSAEDKTRNRNQICRLDDGEPCSMSAGNGRFTESIRKIAAPRNLGLNLDPNTGGYRNQICCLLDAGERCSRSAGSGRFTECLKKIIAPWNLGLQLDPNAKHICTCEYHRQVIRNPRYKTGYQNQICCLLDAGEPCSRPAGRIRFTEVKRKLAAPMKLGLYRNPNAQHIYVCEYHQKVMTTQRSEVHRVVSETEGHQNQICCLLDAGEPCSRLAGRIKFGEDERKLVATRKLGLDLNPNARHVYICEFHKKVTATSRSEIHRIFPEAQHRFISEYHKDGTLIPRSERKRNNSDEESVFNDSDEESEFNDSDVPEVDFSQLPVNSLRRIKRHLEIQTGPGTNKAQLADMITNQLKDIQVNEKEAVTYFMYMVKNNKNKLDAETGIEV